MVSCQISANAAMLVMQAASIVTAAPFRAARMAHSASVIATAATASAARGCARGSSAAWSPRAERAASVRARSTFVGDSAWMAGECEGAMERDEEALIAQDPLEISRALVDAATAHA